MTKRLNHQTYINCPIDIIYKEGKSNKVLILLHGYRQTNSWIFKKLQDVIDDDFHIIAPNAPYLVPRRNPNLTEKTYAWYFFNENRTEYLVPIDDSVRIISEIIEKYVPNHSELILVGFSQGAYLTPFIANNFSKATKCILLSARIRTEILDQNYPFEIHSIHGEEDNIVNPLRSRDCYNEFISKGNRGSFNLIKNLGHEINEEVQKKFKELIC